MNLAEKDLQQIQAKGISLEQINVQLENFKNDFPPFELKKAATITDHHGNTKDSATANKIVVIKFMLFIFMVLVLRFELK